jgi:hypothetical protein
VTDQPPPKREKRRIILWTLLLLLVLAVVWVFGSRDPFAQGVREALGSKPDQLVLNKSFSLPPRAFRYYTFTLPKDSKNVSIVASFDTGIGKSRAADGSAGAQSQAPQTDNGIEIYLLGDSDFAEWQKGITTNSAHGIAHGPKGTMGRDLPDGPGLFYLVFSNRRDPSSSRTVNAIALLRHKSWLPDALRGIKRD